ncbi:SOUL family heme-binding protein [Corallincola spongiicola]|uniref:Heme-binding protein n=1 Tax=Corallincola spongiicola TaxID=2520508 RepID=A0ABY1WUD1_9GAMM|nr:heme-binding protein [Corallincola spongiicola]TAA48356.1 heme-binding protein [Corallincola spongiicola]
MATEEPKYTVLETSETFELRAYAPMIIAETLVDGQMDDASSAGFKAIANYIFGNNTAPSGKAEEISMTAPVAMAAGSENINMTAPVTMQSVDSKWRVHFVMPSEYTMATLPKPNNPAVKIRQIPPTNYAVIQFSGFTGEEKVASQTTQLLEWMKTKGITPRGTPQLARYNPPWTLPFLRRNEVMIAY